MKHRTVMRVLAGLDSAVAIGLGYRWFVLPRIRTWGTTPEEAARQMPGDELVPQPSMRGTHAITIAARPEDIWPWLVQIGYGRAGFYSYAIVERMMGLPITNVDRILPQYQELRAGDRIPMAPHDEGMPIHALERNRHLCLATALGDGAVTWCFGLYPLDERHTRLVSRNQAFTTTWTLWSILRRPASWRVELPMKIFIDIGGLLMVRRMLWGIKKRAEEGLVPARVDPTVQAEVSV